MLRFARTHARTHAHSHSLTHARARARARYYTLTLSHNAVAPQCTQALTELERLCSALPAFAGAWAGRAECAVCMAAPRSTRLRPCCHALLCPPCAARLMRRGDCCPACRAAVERFEVGAFDATFAPA